MDKYILPQHDEENIASLGVDNPRSNEIVEKTAILKSGEKCRLLCDIILAYKNGLSRKAVITVFIRKPTSLRLLRKQLNYYFSKHHVLFQDKPFRLQEIYGNLKPGIKWFGQTRIEDFCEEAETEAF